jgi:Methyltransferase domain
MLGIPLRYLLKHPLIGVADLAADPFEAWTTILDSYVAERERRGPQCPYEADLGWEQQLHEVLGMRWPCDEAREFWELWQQVIGELEAKGIRAGPESFQWWNDGDAGLVRTIWCLTRHLRPKNVVETGVAHGLTSRFILEALKRNGNGHLWSIDLPPLERSWREQIAAAVGEGHSERWTYIKGSSRRRLPQLLSDLGQIDLFIHDSLHSERNVRFELDRSWPALAPKGAIVVGDVDASWGFRSFTQIVRRQFSLICTAEPLRPDLRRFNKKGLFGIILKTPTAGT